MVIIDWIGLASLLHRDKHLIKPVSKPHGPTFHQNFLAIWMPNRIRKCIELDGGVSIENPIPALPMINRKHR